MNYPISDAGLFRNFTATTTLAAGTGDLRLIGILVSSSTGGTLALTGGGVALTGTIAGVAGTFYKIPALSGGDIVITVGGTINATAFWS
jgi:hypothetical protein